MFGADTEQTQMSGRARDVVLVHGAWADGSSWSGVYDALVARGYRVSIVQSPLTSFAEDVAATRRVLARQEGPVILVGHSYGGAVITEAGSAANVAKLVYVSAFVPDVGESTSTFLAGGEPPPLQPSQDGFLFFDPRAFPQAFAQDLELSRSTFLATTQVPTAAAAFSSPVAQAAWHDKPSFYVVASDDRIIPPPTQRQMAQRAHAKVTELPGSHAVYISHAAEVADAIDAAARATH